MRQTQHYTETFLRLASSAAPRQGGDSERSERNQAVLTLYLGLP